MPKRNSQGRRPLGRRLEALEDRQLLSVTTLDTQGGHGAGCGCELCAMPAISAPTQAELAQMDAEMPGDVPVFTDSQAAVPVYHSNPNATAFLHLDFDGNFTPTWGSYSNVSTPAYDTNGDPSTYSSTELTSIYQIWARVSEDYAPFNIDVTTEDRGNYSNRVGLKVAIGGSYNDWYGAPAGGVGYVSSFTSGIANVVYVFVDGTGGGVAKYVAEASSHEGGHGFGLQHQSTYDANGNKTAEYNPGAGNWGPIMGVGYDRALTTWHNGPNSFGPNSLQDDMMILSSGTNGFGFKADDYGGSIGTASPLQINSGAVSGIGLLHVATDLDYFSFSTTGGAISITATGAQYGTNVDLIAQLFNAGGTQVAIAQPTNSFNAPLQATVPAGNYFFAVKSIGTYGRAGQYTLTGSISQQHPQGDLEILDPTSGIVSGWSFDPDDLSKTVKVDFKVDGFAQNLNIQANQTHATQGAHGFAWNLSSSFFDGQPHTLELVAFDAQGGDGVVLDSRNFVFYPGLLAGDANGDGHVTGADFTVWADHEGLLAGTATVADGDFNGDGSVTGADYTIWADNFGAVAAPVAPRQTSPAVAAVDEALTAWDGDAWQLTSRRSVVANEAYAASLSTNSSGANTELRVKRDLRRTASTEIGVIRERFA